MLIEAGLVVAGGLLVGNYFKGKQRAEAEDLGEKVATKAVRERGAGEELDLPRDLHVVIKNGIIVTKLGKGNPYVFEAVLQQMNSLNSPVDFKAKIVEYFKAKAPDAYTTWQVLRSDNEMVKQTTFYPLVAATVRELSKPLKK